MDLRLLFLGTAGAVPTVDRGPTATLVIRGGERILVDCGEGTQRQLIRTVGLGRIRRILLTHLHGDHYLGLPGLLKTMSLQGREEPLELLGPPGLEEVLGVAQRIFGRALFPLVIREATPGLVLAEEDYVLEAARTDHGIASLAWSLRELPRPGRFHPERAIDLGILPGPDFRRLQHGQSVVLDSGAVVEPEQVMDEPRSGRKIVVTGDTRPTDAVVSLAQGASVLVHDATFTQAELSRALETRHSTAREAAEQAARAEVQLLALTHVSSRHGRRDLLEEARSVFPRTILPSDLDILSVPYPDKGLPTLIGATLVDDGHSRRLPTEPV